MCLLIPLQLGLGCSLSTNEEGPHLPVSSLYLGCVLTVLCFQCIPFSDSLVPGLFSCLSSIVFSCPFPSVKEAMGHMPKPTFWFTGSCSMPATSPFPIFLLLALLTCSTTSDRCLLDTYHMSRNLLGTGVLDDSTSPTQSSFYAGARLLFSMNSLGGLHTPMAP